MKNLLFLRNIVSVILSWIPLKAFYPVRNAYFNTRKNGGFTHCILRSLIAVLRYRPIHNEFEKFELADMPGIYIYNIDSKIVRLLYWYGSEGYEGKETLLYQIFCSKATSILELGGNIGYYSILGASANKQARYRVLEPHPISNKILNKNKEFNHLDNLEIIQKAVVGVKTSEQAELNIQIEDTDIAPSGAYLKLQGAEIDRTKKETFLVDLVEAKELIPGVDLIKIDIEGLEQEVLNSILDYLKEKKPFIFLEVRNKAVLLKKYIADVLLTEVDYDLFSISHDRLIKVPKEEIANMNFLRTYGNRDVILINKQLWEKSEIIIDKNMLG